MHVMQKYRSFYVENIKKSKIYNTIIFSLSEKKSNLNSLLIIARNGFYKLVIHTFNFQV